MSRMGNRRPLTSLFVSLSPLIVLGIAIAIVVQSQTPLDAFSPTVEPRATATTGNITQAPTNNEEFKLTWEAAEFQTREALLQTITLEAPPTGRPPTNTPSPFTPGIYDTPYAFFGVPQAYATSNRWQDIVNGERTYVFAGARKGTLGGSSVITQGIVAIEVYSMDLSHYLVTEYKAPGETGILKIVVATGYRLTLVGENGETLYFDVPTRQFVEGLKVTLTAPTATHLPPITPTPTPMPPPTGYPALSVYPQPKTSLPPTRAVP